MTSSRTNSGKSWNFEYDVEAGRSVITDHLGRVERWSWNKDYEALSHTDAMGRTMLMERNEFSLLARVTGYNGGVHLIEYDDNFNRIKEIDPLGGVTGTAWHPVESALIFPTEHQEVYKGF